jgi:hypothetical protein
MKNRGLCLLLSMVLTCCALTEGCGKKVIVANAPAGVDAVAVANWYKATGAFANVADLLQQGEKALRTANSSGLLPDGTLYQNFLRGFGKMAQAQKSAAEYLKTVPQTYGQSAQVRISAYAKDILGVVQDLSNNGVLGIKDANTQRLVSQTISEINSAITFVLSFTIAASVELVPNHQYYFAAYAELREVYVV